MGAPKIVPISDLRADAANLVKQATESREPVFITQRGRATAVLMSVGEYNREIDRLRMLESIMRGQADIRGGRTHTAGDVKDRLEEIIAKYE
jgi:prevent-host-death family protein